MCIELSDCVVILSFQMSYAHTSELTIFLVENKMDGREYLKLVTGYFCEEFLIFLDSSFVCMLCLAQLVVICTPSVPLRFCQSIW